MVRRPLRVRAGQWNGNLRKSRNGRYGLRVRQGTGDAGSAFKRSGQPQLSAGSEPVDRSRRINGDLPSGGPIHEPNVGPGGGSPFQLHSGYYEYGDLRQAGCDYLGDSDLYGILHGLLYKEQEVCPVSPERRRISAVSDHEIHGSGVFHGCFWNERPVSSGKAAPFPESAPAPVASSGCACGGSYRNLGQNHDDHRNAGDICVYLYFRCAGLSDEISLCHQRPSSEL